MSSLWTQADAAELDALAWELVAAIHDHRNNCSDCAAGYPPCPRVTAAIQVVSNWRRARLLLSRAEHLRSGQELVDFGRRLGFTPAEVSSLRARWRAEEASVELAA